MYIKCPAGKQLSASAGKESPHPAEVMETAADVK
jgi:hypothetical protein